MQNQKPRVSLLHSTLCILHLSGASGRTRTDEYEFTKLVLWLLRHRGKVASTAGIAPATSTFARWHSDLTELRGRFDCKLQIAECKIGEMNQRDLQERTKRFALQIIEFWESLPKDETCKT